MQRVTLPTSPPRRGWRARCPPGTPATRAVHQPATSTATVISTSFSAIGHPQALSDPDGTGLWINNGAGGFTDSTAASGIVGGEDRRWQSVIADIDQDGDQDIYSAVDYTENRFWVNQGGGSFVDDALAANADNDWNDMGLTMGDPDNDGDWDLYITNIEDATFTFYSVLLENTVNGPGAPSFVESARTSGLVGGQWGWGTTWADFDQGRLAGPRAHQRHQHAAIRDR